MLQSAAMHITPDELEQKLVAQAATDAALIKGLRMGRATMRTDGDRTVIMRVFLFDDAKALAGYLDLLGLKTVLERKTAFLSSRLKSCSLKIDAPLLDAKKLARLGDTLDRAPASIPATLQLAAVLPGKVDKVAPANAAAGDAAVWDVPSDQFAHVFHAELSTTVPSPASLPLGASAPFDGAAVDALLAGADAGPFLQRLGNRSYPLLHVRLDKRLNVETSLLWITDELSEAMAAYQARVDYALLPELRRNYFEWTELVTLGNQTYLAGGWRARETTPAKKLTGALAVRRDGDHVIVAFTPPRMLNGPGSQADSPERIVAAILVTFPDGREQSAFVRVKNLRAGEAVELRQ